MVIAGNASVSIVIAAFNAEMYIRQCLRSVLAQSFTNWTCVVVDDGSTDATALVCADFMAQDDRFTVIRQDNQGSGSARNHGLATSGQTPFVCFLDADDILLPTALKDLYEAISANERAVGVYGTAEYIDEEGRSFAAGVHSSRIRDRRQMGRFDFRCLSAYEPYTRRSLMVSGTMWPSAIVLHRRNAITLVGGFDESLRQVQDWDLYVRMSLHGKFYPIENQVVWYRQHPGNVTRREESVQLFTLRVRRKTYLESVSSSERRELRRIWRRLCLRWLKRQLTSYEPGTRPGLLASFTTLCAWLISSEPVEPTQRAATLIARFQRPLPKLSVLRD